jgi:4a-hydroxytetrahydrobiopterin dehydratase
MHLLNYFDADSRSAMTKLSDAQVKQALESLDGWEREGNYLTKDYKFSAFMPGIKFVQAVAKIAEKQEHHPDIHIVWTTVTLKITTHDEGGLTKWDVALAQEIDKRLGQRKTSKKTR